MDTVRIETKSFCFYYQTKTYGVICEASMTIQEALQTNDSFNNIYEMQKKMLITRRKDLVTTVTPDFPVCLLDKDEILHIDFKSVQNNSNQPTSIKEEESLHPAFKAKHENFVKFNINKKGGKKIRKVLEHSNLIETNYVCVYAVKTEKVSEALRRDGRFKEEIFLKGVLSEESSNIIINLSNPVETLDGKRFQIIVDPNRTKTQGSTQKNEKYNVPAPPQEKNPNEDSTKAQEKKTETLLKQKPGKYPETKEIPNTQEILNLLRAQHGDLLKILIEREELKNNIDVKRFFRKEYDKSAQSFSKVKIVKRLMKLSDSVCLICVDSSGIGTGFLLFDRFVLTNAHVVRDLDCDTFIFHKNLTAVFGFEDLKTIGKMIPVKDVVAFFMEKDTTGNYLDFALLELSIDGELNSDGKCPELLRYYSATPSSGGVCIIGHPGGEVKQMDPCFIIAKENIKQETKKHIDLYPNLDVVHLVTQKCLSEDKEIHESQIIYNTCFFHGSSGSPLFDEKCNLIGVHTGGYDFKGELNETRNVEFGLPMFPILVQIFIQCSENRPDIIQYFENQNNMKLVLKVAEEHLQSCTEPTDI